MTFWQFLVNYFSPFYFIARCFFLGWAAMSWYVLGYMTSAMMNFETSTTVLVFKAVAVILAWNALRPWGKGISFNDINRNLERLNSKYK